jgi:hypothetical protein
MENYKIWLGDLNNEDSRDMLTQYFLKNLENFGMKNFQRMAFAFGKIKA